MLNNDAVMLKNIVVFGAGTMGHSLALLFAKAGCQVQLIDTEVQALESARLKLQELANNLASLGVCDAAAEVMSRLEFSTDGFSKVAGADMVLEVIVENPAIKRRFYEQLAQVVCPETIIASNTSVLDIYEHAPESLHSQLLMTHYFVPPHLVPLVEIVGKNETLVQRVVEFLQALNLVPVVLQKFARGFIINRIQRAMNQEIFQLLNDGVASAEAIDLAIRASLGLRLGVMNYLERCDQTGLDVMLNNYKQTPLGLVTNEAPPAILEQMVQAGKLGLKTGQGFYSYTQQTASALERDRKLVKLRQFLAELNA